MARPDERVLLLGADALTAAGIGAVGGGHMPAILGTACLVATMAAVGLYRPRLRLSALDDLPRIALAVALGWMVTAWLVPAMPTSMLPPATSWGWWAILAGGVTAARIVALALLRLRRRRLGGEPTLVVGGGQVADRLADGLAAQPELGLHPIGLVGGRHGSVRPGRLRHLGDVEDTAEIAARNGVTTLVVAFTESSDAELVAALRACRESVPTVLVVPRLFEMNVSALRAETIGGVPVVRLRKAASKRLSWRLKRAVDVMLAAAALAVLAPLVAVCALAVRWEIGRDGVIFRQERIGDRGRRFHILKFRSLTPSSDLESQALWSVADDTRIGRVGRLIRRTSLDEIPQLVNVLRGEMSLVGPRPERPVFAEVFGRKHRHYDDRLRVPAGMTGWAQIHGLRGDTSIDDRATYDNYYIENWSLGLDVAIMLRTVGTLIPHPRGTAAEREAAAGPPGGQL